MAGEITQELVDNAEKERQNIRNSKMARVVSGRIRPLLLALTDDQLVRSSFYTERFNPILGLARVSVDSDKIASNNDIKPWAALTDLKNSLAVIQHVYEPQAIKREMVRREQQGIYEPQPFYSSTRRDVVMVIDSASDFYRGGKRKNLIGKETNILTATYDRLPENHPTKPLIGMEIDLLHARRGESFDERKIIEDLLLFEERNPGAHEGIAAASSWAAALFRNTGNSAAEKEALETFKKHSAGESWEYKLNKARKKAGFKAARHLLFSTVGQVLVNNTMEEELYNGLMAID